MDLLGKTKRIETQNGPTFFTATLFVIIISVQNSKSKLCTRLQK